MTKHFDQILNCINAKGEIISTPEIVKQSMNSAELLGESLLGTTLIIRGKKFIIRMLEIYYGGVADDSHDWYRNRFEKKTSKFIQHTNVQNQNGFRIYLSSLNTSHRYTRLDIVAGNEGVPISFLLRSVWQENGELIGSKNGNPNIVLQAMGIQPEDHGVLIKHNLDSANICIEDTHNEIIASKGLTIERSKRINLKSDFEDKNQLLWNLCLV